MYFYRCSEEALIPQRWSPNVSICIVLYVLHKNIAISIMRVSSISRILRFHLQLNFQISCMKHFSPLISSVVNIMLSKKPANTCYVLLQKKNTNFTSQDNHQPLYPGAEQGGGQLPPDSSQKVHIFIKLSCTPKVRIQKETFSLKTPNMK